MPPPTRFGRYLLTQRLATGGMAEIYLAKFLGVAGFERDLVIKKVLPHWSLDRDFTAMLIDEAKINVQLNHPNIVQIYELGRERDVYYIAMEYVEGMDLRKLLQSLPSHERIPLDITLFLITEILSGLGYAHQKCGPRGESLQIVHRDISPQNILLSFDGAVKITDFGIAKATLQSHETMTGVLKGKCAYMSPEQADQRRLDHRSDLFAVGIVLYELVTGERLFGGRGDLDTLDRVRRAQVSFSKPLENIVPIELRQIILKSLAKKPEERFPDATAYYRALIQFAQSQTIDLGRAHLVKYLQKQCLANVTQVRKCFQEHETKTRQYLAENPTVISIGNTDKTRSLTTMQSRQEMDETCLLVQTDVLLETPPLQSLPRKPNLLFLTSIGIALCVVVSLWLWHLSTRHPEASAITPTPLATKPVVITSHPSPVVIAAPVPLPTKLPEQPNVATPKLEQSKSEHVRGLLSVQAIPWGFVSIDGQGSSETPLQKRAMEAGNHRVEVVYEPDHAHVSQTVRIKSNEHLFCIANFKKDEKTFSCHDSGPAF